MRYAVTNLFGVMLLGAAAVAQEAQTATKDRLTLTQALEAAKKDGKLVLWFRVNGDLDGFM